MHIRSHHTHSKVGHSENSAMQQIGQCDKLVTQQIRSDSELITQQINHAANCGGGPVINA